MKQFTSTRVALDKLPVNIRQAIERLHEEYKRHRGEKILLARADGYCSALRDVGLITETERRLLFCYTTI